jgi:hypothetical protein
MELEYIYTQKNKKMLLFQGYAYHKKEDMKEGVTRWVCSKTRVKPKTKKEKEAHIKCIAACSTLTREIDGVTETVMERFPTEHAETCHKLT